MRKNKCPLGFITTGKRMVGPTLTGQTMKKFQGKRVLATYFKETR